MATITCIGSSIAATLGDAGFIVVLAARSTAQSQPARPDNVDEVAADINLRGGTAVGLHCDVVEVESLHAIVRKTMNMFGRIDAVIYNSGAVWWARIQETPLKRFDLLHSVNSRGFYALVQAVLPTFAAAGHGKVIAVAPPIYSRFVQGKAAYAMSKFSMTTLCLGLAHEYGNKNLAFTTLWPATGIESAVTTKLDSDPKLLRKPAIFADACRLILDSEPQAVNGQTLIDEDFLREHGGVQDFSMYQTVEGIEPPRMMPRRFPDLSVAEEHAQPVFDVFSVKSRL